MAILSVIGGVILLCVIAALWAIGSMNSWDSNFGNGNKAVDRREPRPGAPGLN